MLVPMVMSPTHVHHQIHHTIQLQTLWDTQRMVTVDDYRHIVAYLVVVQGVTMVSGCGYVICVY